MINTVHIGCYIPGESFLHRADPRIKILCAIAFAITVFFTYPIYCLLSSLGFITAISLLFGIPILYSIKALKPLLYLILLTTIINIFAIKGIPAFTFYSFSISKECIEISITLILRLTSLVICSSILTLTTSPMSLASGIEFLIKPISIIGINPREIATMVSIAIRFIPVLSEEANRIINAQTARGVNLEEGNIFVRAKQYVPILIPLMVNSLCRADELATAMEARCYGLCKSPTQFKQLCINTLDIIMLITVTLFCLIVLYFSVFA